MPFRVHDARRFGGSRVGVLFLRVKTVVDVADRILILGEDGSVFSHDVLPGRDELADAVPLPGPPVGVNPDSKWIFTTPTNRIVVITHDGRVFSHEVLADRITDARHHPGPPVAANPQDKWVICDAPRLASTLFKGPGVITKDGRYFRHFFRDDGGFGEAEHIRADDNQLIAANPQDKWVVRLRSPDRIVVITEDGHVFSHGQRLLGHGPPHFFVPSGEVSITRAEAHSGSRVAFNPQDRWVVSHGPDVVVIDKDGNAFAHRVDATP